MRSIFRKLDRGHKLSEEEYKLLYEYIDDMGRKSFPSYAVFYQHYAEVLERGYNVILPLHPWGMDDLINYLLSHPELISEVHPGRISMRHFPSELHPYLEYSFRQPEDYKCLKRLVDWLEEVNTENQSLPQSRQGEVVYLYEDANPYKEAGLKAHFDRLGRYSFITRLQSYRYLTRNKARSDRIEVITPDQLGGIFTNKEKSIYYFIFLSEHDPIKAGNACRLLNTVLGLTPGGGQ